jgi:chemotaxis signal transduction protein
MRQLVRFHTADGVYAVPVEHAREVRTADGLLPLPSPRPGVAGLLARGDDAVPVLALLGAGHGHVLVLDSGGRVFGLLVEAVTGVESVDEASVAPPPPGQDDPIVAGVIHEGETMVLIADVAELARSLDR